MSRDNRPERPKRASSERPGAKRRDDRPERPVKTRSSERGGSKGRSDRSERSVKERSSKRVGSSREKEPQEGLAFGFHAVRTALEVNPQRVERLILSRELRDGRSRKLVSLAKQGNVPYQQVPRDALDRLAGGLNHQGMAARISEADLLNPDELMEGLPADPLLITLDEVSDPRNVGAILRTAAAVGAHGMFLPGHRSSGLSPAVRRVAQGGLELVPVARAGNLSSMLRTLKKEGITPVALDPAGGVPYWEADLTSGVILVAGSEEKGVRPGVLKECPVRVVIPISADIGSLNVSVAMGIVLAEVSRQRSVSSAAVATARLPESPGD